MDAQLYTLTNKDWKPLELLITDQDDAIIYQLMSSKSTSQLYAIVVFTERVEQIVKDYGGVIATENDFLRVSLHTYSGDVLFGDKVNIRRLSQLQR